MIVQRLLGQGFEVGYNAMYDRVENLIDAGVLDPAKASPGSGTKLHGGRSRRPARLLLRGSVPVPRPGSHLP